jgi:hypothetical protein
MPAASHPYFRIAARHPNGTLQEWTEAFADERTALAALNARGYSLERIVRLPRPGDPLVGEVIPPSPVALRDDAPPPEDEPIVTPMLDFGDGGVGSRGLWGGAARRFHKKS